MNIPYTVVGCKHLFSRSIEEFDGPVIQLRDIAQHLPGKCKVLSVIPGTKKTKKRKRKEKTKSTARDITQRHVA